MIKDAQELKNWAHERVEWLTKEINNGGNFAHLDARRDELLVVIGKINEMASE